MVLQMYVDKFVAVVANGSSLSFRTLKKSMAQTTTLIVH